MPDSQPLSDHSDCEGWTAARWAENAAYWRDQAMEKNAALAGIEAENERLRLEIERVDPLHRLARKFSGPIDEETR